MSKIAHDQYIDADEEEETCPLCIEDFDLTDKGFKPCPCGYQICQFCYNNVKINMNGLCPACRRVYDDKNIEYKQITPEETAAYKARQAQKQKKTQAALQREKAKADADLLSRRHLAGLRVVQKNLVYVTGIAPKMQEEELLQTLRGDKYFGRYGKIIKIVVSKARDKHDSVGVYVTYERKEDAAGCIAAVDGYVSDDRTLRAQFGTTKYCSAYLRGDTCMNRNCMFLHEPGEAKDSYSRADLSALNAGSSQTGDSKPPPPQSQQPVSAAIPMARQSSDPSSSPTTSDRPALPSTASWASKPQSTPAKASPAPITVVPAPPAPEAIPQPARTPLPTRQEKPRVFPLAELLKKFNIQDLCLIFSSATLSEQDRVIVEQYPALFDSNGGPRQRLRKQREDEARRIQLETQAFRESPDVDNGEDAPELSGSMQLGGEPEDRLGLQSTIEGQLDQAFSFGGAGPERGMTPQQHQQFLLQNLRSGTTSTQPPGHQRNVSRFSFANDTASASTAVKPVANPKLLNQQSSMMPPSSSFGTQQSNFFTSNVQGPPPGLKTTGTPPVSGGMTFGQGHGFTTGGLPYGAAAGVNSRNQNDEMMRDLLRNRGTDSTTKLTDDEFPPLGPIRQASISSLPSGLQDTRRSTPALPPGLEDAVQSRRGTPTRPPGLGKPDDEELFVLQKRPTALPDLEGTSRASSRASLRRAASTQIVPALPLRAGTPAKAGSRPSTPSRLISRPVSPVAKIEAEIEDTPTRSSKGKKAAVIDDADAISNDQEPIHMQPPERLDAEPAVQKSAAELLLERHQQLDALDSKRKHPGKLDISAAVEAQIAATAGAAEAVEPTTMARKIAQSTAATSVPSSPSLAAASPVLKTAPRTIRLVQTPRVETPPVITTAIPPGVRKLPSRQPSVASMNVPGTPTSEHISTSDNVSVNSMSRANTPPPAASKVGTAPVRNKTKSQQKKDRQEKAKAIEEAKAEAFAHIVVDEPMQEALVSRKKKTKKEKEIKPKPKPTAIVKDEEPVETTPHISRPATPVELAPEPVPTPPAVKPGPELSPPTTPTMSPAQLISELRSMEPALIKSFEALFKVPAVSNAKSLNIPAKDIEGHAAWRATEFGSFKLDKDEVNKLLSGLPSTRPFTGNENSAWSRAMITPGGAQLRALSEELEQRFLELEKHIMDLPEELRFRPTKPQNETRFPTMDLKALKKTFDSKGSRGVSVMEQMVQDGSAMKKGAFLVDEVSKYINEFVMPPATPPPSAGRGAAGHGQQQVQNEQAVANAAAAGASRDMPVPPVEIADRQLHEARRAVDDRESALRKVIRKNKKLLGLN